MAGSIALLLFVTILHLAVFSHATGGPLLSELADVPSAGFTGKQQTWPWTPPGWVYPSEKVIVQNRAGDKRDIWVHCFSGDDDLGVHLLRYWQVFVIKFTPNVWFVSSTEFFCTVTWYYKGKRSQHTIIVFYQKFGDDDVCNDDPLSEKGGCKYLIGMNSFSGPDGINFWNQRSKRLIK